MRRVADERQPVAHERTRHRKSERIGAARSGDFDVAELEAETLFQFSVEFIVRQRDDALGLMLFFRPHDGRALALQRQNRERSRRQEMLLGTAVMFALMGNGGDDARLVVVPAGAADAGRLANERTCAVGGDQEFRGQHIAASKVHVDAIRGGFKSRHRVGAKLDPVRRGPLDQRRDQRRVLDHMRERLARRDLAAERQIGRPHRVLQFRVGDDHVENRLRAIRNLVPDSDGLEQPPRRGGNRRGARVAGVALGERRIGDRHLEGLTEPLTQRDGQRQAGESAAADQHIDARHVPELLCVRHAASISLRCQ